MTIAEAIYLLCAVTSLTAAVLLLRQYRARPSPLLLWSCIGFFGLAANNALVMLDFALITGRDLSLPRTLTASASMLLLLYGLLRGADA
jgi:hypothetical protein